MPHHPVEQLPGAAEIEREPLAGDRLQQAQQGGLTVARGLAQGRSQGAAAEIGASALHESDRGDHEHGLLHQRRPHRAVGHLFHAQGHRLTQQLDHLAAHGAVAGAIELRQVAVALAEGFRRLQLPQLHRELGLQQGELDHHLLQGQSRSCGDQWSHQGE